MKNFDNIYVILGCGLDDDGNISNDLKMRCNLALKYAKKDDLIITSSSFTLNKSPKISYTPKFKLFSEASVAFEYLKKKKVLSEIVCEQQSHDTIGSILFIFYLYTKFYLFTKIFFITSSFHIMRVKMIVSHIFKLTNNKFEYGFLTAENNDISDLRTKHEQSQMALYKKNYLPIKKIEDFFYYFIAYHTNYNEHFSSSKSFGSNDGY